MFTSGDVDSYADVVSSFGVPFIYTKTCGENCRNKVTPVLKLL